MFPAQTRRPVGAVAVIIVGLSARATKSKPTKVAAMPATAA